MFASDALASSAYIGLVDVRAAKQEEWNASRPRSKPSRSAVYGETRHIGSGGLLAEQS